MFLARSSITRPCIVVGRRAAGRQQLLHTGKPPDGAADKEAASSPSSSPSSSSPSTPPAAAANALPAPGQTSSSSSSSRGHDVTPLPVGSSASLDALGPLVVNVDGSVGRVGNWLDMTPAEREATLRLLRRRNPQRLAALKAQAGQARAP